MESNENRAHACGERDSWEDCWSMTELGDLDRPHITAWFRHLAAGPADRSAVQKACAC